MMRYASPNELRTISREDLGWYNNVVIGAIYTFDHGYAGDDGKLLSLSHYYSAVRQIVEKHPFLSVVVKDKHTDKAFYEHVPSIDLTKHISIVQDGRDIAREASETARIERLLPSLADYAHPADSPPWSVTILPLSERTSKTSPARLFIAFAFSHMLGDGMNGLTFHQDLLQGLRGVDASKADVSPLVTIPASTKLDEPFDTPKRLPISWGYLLGPLFAVCLPQWLAILLGIRASTSTLEQGTWIGPPMFHNKAAPSPPPSPARPSSTSSSSSSSFHKQRRASTIGPAAKPTDETQLRLIEIPADQVAAALRASREHGAKLTAVLHQIIVHALSAALPSHTREVQRRKSFSVSGSSAQDDGSSRAMAITRFASQTAINMRPTLGIPNTTMGLYVNGCYGYYARSGGGTASTAAAVSYSDRKSPLSDAEWAAAAAMTTSFALCGARLADQPIGLLRYAPSVRGWMAKKMGQRRDCSYEVSNLLAFAPPPQRRGSAGEEAMPEKVDVDWIVFAQPRNPTSAPIVFDVVSVKGGILVITVVWQAGALADVTSGVEDEGRLVDEICQGIRDGFARFV
ncbi:hypothetical protein Micbo1qcDRAFT_156767 [Microdochium bolleyi]|uniref:Alcohol acetyltransferase n=1 Tax=Microdochium bolleyi TaxID=196109 RepID=A0A136JCV1_9PEZI|nr:hypothetical protein Micbo1qcDRAFT_156767 [Microdochium bolleyi]